MKKILFATAMILSSIAVNAQTISVSNVEASTNDMVTIKI